MGVAYCSIQYTCSYYQKVTWPWLQGHRQFRGVVTDNSWTVTGCDPGGSKVLTGVHP